jgi:cyclomaltodextrinase
LATDNPEESPRRLAQLLQFTLPGSPNLYYGSEVGMTGGWDPAQRGPMRWDRVQAHHPDLDWTRSLTRLRREHRALRVGDFRRLESERLIAFERYTDRAADLVLVVANPSGSTVTETLAVREGLLMDDARLLEALQGPNALPDGVKVGAGFITLTLPPWGWRVLRPEVPDPNAGYSVYKRIP